MVNKAEQELCKAAQELGKKGGQAKSAAKTAAARANARKPRKPIPDTKQLIRLAMLELETERDRCSVLGQEYNGLKINGHDLIDVLAHHLKTLPVR